MKTRKTALTLTFLLLFGSMLPAHASDNSSMNCAIEKINQGAPNEPILTFSIAMGEHKSHFVGGLEQYDVEMAITPAQEMVPATIIATLKYSTPSQPGSETQQATVTVSATSEILALDINKNMQLVCMRKAK